MPAGTALTAGSRSALERLNAGTPAAAEGALAPLFEGAPQFLARLAAARPFRDEADLFARAEQLALAMPEAEQLELINAHPRIGAPAAAVSASSFVEQGYDARPGETAGGAPSQSQARIQADLARLNAMYEARFGFRFVVFVAGRPQSAIVPLLRERMAGARDAECQAALRDVVAIARDRWAKAAAVKR
jgi:2-oxo-4-hydroxy-4-carboxy--5-ureidoimidazoline (OHCU) decarboxylase